MSFNMLEKIKNIKKEKLLKISIIILAFLIYFIWSLSQPYKTAPDEGMKFDICKYIAQENLLPYGGDEAIRDEIWGISYGFTPILSYIISAIFIKIVMIFTRRRICSCSCCKVC